MNKFSKMAALALAFAPLGFALPKATEIYSEMGLGYNIGNTLEVPSDPTAWGNIVPTAEIVNAIKEAGFSTVRLPTAWDSHATDGVIDANWFSTVKGVVDLCINNGMYVILNSHWDNGWLEDHVFSEDSSEVYTKQYNYWTQIATYFADYDEHLIFASANEPGVNDGWGSDASLYGDNGQLTFKDERMKILQSYHEACLKAVRATGGNNSTRTVVVQMPRTEIDKYTYLYNYYPEDPAGSGYTMAEAHYYPYQYSLMESDASWGNSFYYYDGLCLDSDTDHCMGSDASTLGTKLYTEAQFQKLQTAFVARGIPVVIGEFGAIKRLSLVGDALQKHLEGRAAFYGDVASIAKTHGITVCVWDTGDEGDKNMTIIRRQEKFNDDNGGIGTIVDYETLNAMREAFDLAVFDKSSIGSLVEESISTTDKALYVTYKTKQSDSSEVGTIRFNLGGADWSEYVALSFQIRMDGQSAGPAAGETYGWTSVSLFAMSGSDWAWSDVNLGTVDELSGILNTLKITLNGCGSLNLDLSDASVMDAIGINVYGTQFSGTMYLDNMLLYKADGTIDTLQSFNKKSSIDAEGIATSYTYVQANTKGTNAISKNTVASLGNVQFSLQNGRIVTTFNSVTNGPASVLLLDAQGRVIAKESLTTHTGANEVSLSTTFKGNAFIVVKQGSQKLVRTVHIR